jgi:hypothetical protein
LIQRADYFGIGLHGGTYSGSSNLDRIRSIIGCLWNKYARQGAELRLQGAYSRRFVE